MTSATSVRAAGTVADHGPRHGTSAEVVSAFAALSAWLLVSHRQSGEGGDSFSAWVGFRWRLRLSWRGCGQRTLA
jgi:hypothetical protein